MAAPLGAVALSPVPIAASGATACAAAWAVPLGANAGKRIEGISGSAAAPSGEGSLAACKTKCENDADCWAIQFSPSEFKVGKNCWYFTQAEFLADSLYQTPSNFLTIKQHHFDRSACRPPAPACPLCRASREAG